MNTRTGTFTVLLMTMLCVMSFFVVTVRAAATSRGESEPLDSPTTLVVNSTAATGDGICDASECTMSEAVETANADLDHNTITFQIAGEGPHTLGAIPTIRTSMTIDGYTQPGARPNTNPITQSVNTILKIVAGSLNIELYQYRGGVHIRGLALHYGISSKSSLFIEGSFIGTDLTGMMAKGSGIRYDSPGIGRLTVGGGQPEQRNVVSGIDAGPMSDVEIVGNFVGIDASGDRALGNGTGIYIAGTGSIIDNVVSGNLANGIAIGGGTRSLGNAIRGNRVGTDRTGTQPIGNRGVGISIGGYGNEIAENLIAYNGSDGLVIGLGKNFYANKTHHNVIAHNGGNGITVYDFGVSDLTSNSIYGNAKLGIDLMNDGVTPNDLGDDDEGANQLQNYPEMNFIDFEEDNKLVLVSTLNSKPNRQYRIEVFYGPHCDESGYGEGEKRTAFADIFTDSTGHRQFGITLSVLPDGSYLTATATDSEGNTSEFSKCFRVELPPAFIIIEKESQPKSTQDFVFYGPRGKFILDDALSDDNDGFGRFVIYPLPPGSYNFAEVVYQSWYLADIRCSGSNAITKDMANRSVNIQALPATITTCTFINQRRVNLQATKFSDLNGDRLFTINEPTLFGWEMVLYNSQNMRLLGKVTDNNGSVVFNNRIPGTYKLCETPKVGWSNTLPGAIDASLARPCYNLTLQPGQSASVLFGNTLGSVVRPLEEIDPNSGVTLSELPDINEPEGEEMPEESESNQNVYLPLIGR